MLYYCLHSGGRFSLVGVKKGEESSAEMKIVFDNGSIQKISIKSVAEPFGKQMYLFLKSKVGTGFIYIIDGFPFFIFDIRALPEPEPEPEGAAELKAAAEPEAAAKVEEEAPPAPVFKPVMGEAPKILGGKRRIKRATRRGQVKQRRERKKQKRTRRR